MTKEKKKRAEHSTAHHRKSARTSTIKVKVDKMPKHQKVEEKKPKKESRPKTKKEPKEKRKRYPRRRGKIIKWIGIIILVLAATIFLFTTPLFNLTKIEVIGNDRVSDEEIISLSQLKLNENMFKSSSISIKENIKGNAYIEDVKIKRMLPNKIQIEVVERKVKFMIKLLNNYAYINSQGYILELTKETTEVPIIEGIETAEEEIVAGERLNVNDLRNLETALKIERTFEENEISKYITSINLKDSSDYIVYLKEKKKTVHLGDNSNLSTKVLYVKAIIDSEGKSRGDIFVNGDLNNGFQPFFRKKV